MIQSDLFIPTQQNYLSTAETPDFSHQQYINSTSIIFLEMLATPFSPRPPCALARRRGGARQRNWHFSKLADQFFVQWFFAQLKEEKTSTWQFFVPLFGMVNSRDPNSRGCFWWPPTFKGMKRSRLFHHLEISDIFPSCSNHWNFQAAPKTFWWSPYLSRRQRALQRRKVLDADLPPRQRARWGWRVSASGRREPFRKKTVFKQKSEWILNILGRCVFFPTYIYIYIFCFLLLLCWFLDPMKKSWWSIFFWIPERSVSTQIMVTSHGFCGPQKVGEIPKNFREITWLVKYDEMARRCGLSSNWGWSDAGSVFFLSCTKRSRVLKGKHEPTTESYRDNGCVPGPYKTPWTFLVQQSFRKKAVFFQFSQLKDDKVCFYFWMILELA